MVFLWCTIPVLAIDQVIPPQVSGFPAPEMTVQPAPSLPSMDIINERETTVVSLENSHTSNPNTTFRRGLMHFTEEELRQMDAIRQSLPKAASFNDVILPQGSKSLLNSVPYTGKERDQGYCGNCWVWASTGAMEIDHSIKNNIKNRLSVQYFNSHYNGGADVGNACRGGFTSTFAEYYNNTLRKGIPWSNTNASFADYYWQSGPTAMPAAFISTNPNYPLTSVINEELEVRNGQSAAINTIKGHLNSNRPVLWYFALPSEGWNAFYQFWDNQPESAIWNPDPYAGTALSGAHEVLIIGYDDTGSDPYWIALNSWGVTSGRPYGLFRVTMNMNYNAVMTSGSYTQYAHYFDVIETKYSTSPTPSPTPTSTPTITPTSTPTVTPTITPTVTPTPEPGYGNLSVSSSPSGARIGIDGVMTGNTTPAQIPALSAGIHHLSLEKEGYAAYSSPFSIKSGETTYISATLNKTGIITINSRPQKAQIWIDDTDTGKTTPATFRSVAAGTHSITLKKNGYADYTRTITLQTGKTVSVYGILVSTGGRITVTSNPSGASLFVDGTDTGYQTPRTISGLSPGSHTVLLKKNNYLDWMKEVYVNAQMTTSVHAGMLPGGTNGSLFVYSNPSGASVYIDGQWSGYQTPKTITGIVAGDHTIALSKPGYNDWSKEVIIKSGVKTTVYGRLMKNN